MSDRRSGTGKVVVNRSMPLDGFIAGRPEAAPNWPRMSRFVAREDAAEPGSVDYPFSGPMFPLSHRELEPPDSEVTILSGDIGEAVATARAAARGKDLEVLGADVAGQCLERGLVDEILVYVLPMLAGEGVPFSSPGPARIELEPMSSTRSGAATILRFRVRT